MPLVLPWSSAAAWAKRRACLAGWVRCEFEGKPIITKNVGYTITGFEIKEEVEQGERRLMDEKADHVTTNRFFSSFVLNEPNVAMSVDNMVLWKISIIVRQRNDVWNLYIIIIILCNSIMSCKESSNHHGPGVDKHTSQLNSKSLRPSSCIVTTNGLCDIF